MNNPFDLPQASNGFPENRGAVEQNGYEAMNPYKQGHSYPNARPQTFYASVPPYTSQNPYGIQPEPAQEFAFQEKQQQYANYAPKGPLPTGNLQHTQTQYVQSFPAQQNAYQESFEAFPQDYFIKNKNNLDNPVNNASLNTTQLSKSELDETLSLFDPFMEANKRDQNPEKNRRAFVFRRVDFLHSHGLINEAEKELLKELLDVGDKDLEKKLIHGMKDGNVEYLRSILTEEQKKRESFGLEEETDSDGTITDGDGQGRSLYEELVQAQVAQEKNKPPHPRAGGFKNDLPACMYVIEDKLVGTILLRVSSKKLFRKWKPVFFVMEMNKISFYEDARLWELHSEPRLSFPLHPLMLICKPTLKRTYSVMDDGRRVYYCVFRENPPGSVSYESRASSSNDPKPLKFSHAMETRRICKFGAYRMEEISAFAHAIHGVVSSLQRKGNSKTKHGYPSSGRYG